MNTRASLQSFLAGSDLEQTEGKKKFENTLSPFRAVSWKSVCLPALVVQLPGSSTALQARINKLHICILTRASIITATT